MSLKWESLNELAIEIFQMKTLRDSLDLKRPFLPSEALHLGVMQCSTHEILRSVRKKFGGLISRPFDLLPLTFCHYLLQDLKIKFVIFIFEEEKRW